MLERLSRLHVLATAQRTVIDPSRADSLQNVKVLVQEWAQTKRRRQRLFLLTRSGCDDYVLADSSNRKKIYILPTDLLSQVAIANDAAQP